MQKNKRLMIIYTSLIMVSVLFMLLFAYNTSPLVQYLGVDSGMYLVMGRDMARGGTLYWSLFDHKGPLIFIFNMLPQLLIEGTTGVWLLELGLMAAASIMLFNLARRYISWKSSFCVSLVYIWVTVTLFNGGNYTEEYSNFFCVISLLVFDGWLRGRKVSAPMAYILGVCFACAFFMRPNNIALIVAIILFIGIDMLKNSRREIGRVLLFGIFGILTVTLPLFIYHGCTGTLYDMLYATVLHNLRYCQVGMEHFSLLPNGNAPQLLCFFAALGVNLVAICTCYSSDKIKSGNFILFATVVVALFIWIGKHPFLYYWTLLAPLSAYSAIYILKHGMKIKNKAISFLLPALAVALMFANSFGGTELAKNKEYITEYKRSAAEMMAQIPETERDDCFAYNIPAMFLYEENVVTPCRYFTMQSWMSKTNPAIAEYCVRYAEENEPAWILSYDESGSSRGNELSPLLDRDYTLAFQNHCGYLYKRVSD